MADLLYLSYWLRGFGRGNELRWFGAALAKFPFSAAAGGITSLRVYALEQAEPPLLETCYSGGGADAIVSAAAEFQSPDCAYLAGGCWDLWQQQDGWKLLPAPVSVCCYGPEFENEMGDHLRFELGLDSHFLPPAGEPQGAALVKSNIQSVLRLARELDQSLPVRGRRLWTESGEDFAARLASFSR
ncbi:MAG: hypothetical protein IT159_05080 [Bryobacterales bacterium]|nr:hypothetical protein [Bryobacterales bacterium]